MSKPSKPKTSLRYSEAFKLQVIEQIEKGTYTNTQAARIYGCAESTIHTWLKNYGKNHLLNKVVRIQTMEENDRVKELEKQVTQLKQTLADSHMDQKLSESYYQLACRRLGVDPEEFKKKLDTKRSK